MVLLLYPEYTEQIRSNNIRIRAHYYYCDQKYNVIELSL
jgi:hypothetical protein